MKTKLDTTEAVLALLEGCQPHGTQLPVDWHKDTVDTAAYIAECVRWSERAAQGVRELLDEARDEVRAEFRDYYNLTPEARARIIENERLRQLVENAVGGPAVSAASLLWEMKDGAK